MQTQRVAFVIGGSGDIGAEICRTLHKNGFKVAIGYNNSAQVARQLAASFGTLGLAVHVDACNAGALQQARQQIESVWGGVDTLVYAAGAEDYCLLSEEPESSIRAALDCNLTGAILAAREFSPRMVSDRFGRIVLLSSVWGVCGASMESVYSAAKAGLIGFAKALAWELAPSGVTANTVSPGFIDTKMNARFTPDERAAIIEEIPSCRAGTPADVAAAVQFLVSRESEYTTGQNLVVSGGYKNI